MTFDPVLLAVIDKGLQQVCSEMDLVQEKTAFSPVISEAFDRSNGIYGLSDGRVIAQGATGMPIFIGVMQETVRSVIAERPDLGDGDVVLVNDPYQGGTHLMDVKMVRPFHYGGRLWCYLASTGHWPDTGGMVPGGFNSTATEIHQEGLRIPPVRLVRGGVMDEDLLRLVLANVRVCEERIGDVQAQLAALETGVRRLTALLDRYGADTVEAALAELDDRAEQAMRAHLAAIPDGTYAASAFMDSDGVEDRPLEIAVDLHVRDSDLRVELARSSPPCAGPMNSVWASTLSAVYLAIKHLFPDVPINAGGFRPIEVVPPEGTFLLARYPKPVAGCAAEVSQRVVEAVLLALAEALPARAFAAPAGTSGNLSIGGHDPETGRDYIMYYFSGGGYGGWWAGDGIANGCSTIGISKSQPVEVIEQRYPVLIERFELRTGSGGPGRYRGGLGVRYRMTLRRGRAKASFLMDHGRSGPPGIRGGGAGAPNRIRVCRAGRAETPAHLSKGEGYALGPGDWVEVETPGGGGYGDPRTRDPDRVDRDRHRGLLGPPARPDGGEDPA